MASIPKQTGIPCKFKKPWNPGGICGELTDNGLCSEHEELKCCSCGAAATHDCDTGMGGLSCGASLCDGCTHSSEKSGHVKVEVEQKFWEDKGTEEEARKASRGNPVQRKDSKGNPLNLYELLKNPTGYALEKAHYLLLTHGLMATFPAIVDDRSGSKGRIILSTNKELLIAVWRKLEMRPSEMCLKVGYVGNGVVYLGTGGEIYDQEEMAPIQLLTAEEAEKLPEYHTEGLSESEPCIRWAFGLMGGGSIDERQFEKQVEKAKALT